MFSKWVVYLIFSNFSQTPHENEKNWIERARASLATPLDSPIKGFSVKQNEVDKTKKLGCCTCNYK